MKNENALLSVFVFYFLLMTNMLNAQWDWYSDNSHFRIRNNVNSQYYFDFTADNNLSTFQTNRVNMRLGVLNNSLWHYPIQMQHNAIIFRTNSLTNMLIQNGRIGINTGNPNTGFHIHEKMLKLTGLDPEFKGYGGPTVLFGRNQDNNGNYAITYNINVNGLNFWKPWPAIDEGVAQTPVLFLSDRGLVGIKTYSPTADFTVFGSVLIGDPSTVSMPNPHIYSMYVQKGILAEKLKIALHTTTDWSDNVFFSDYPLRPLNEVKKFISQNGHLPDVPSASEIVGNGGYDVLEMDAILLKKIEELTLYLLKLSEENHELKERILLLETK